MKLFLIGGMEDLNFNYCYKITYESGETYDRRRNELSVEISKEDYKKIITGVLQVIIPGLFEPPVRTLRATIPENESHIFR